MATGTQIPLDEYLSKIYDPDCEYIDGELVARNVGEGDHSGIQAIITAKLYNQQRKKGIYVFPELRVQVAPRRFRIPDITVIKHQLHGRILREPPFLCVEILSPEDRAARLRNKIDDYLSFGVPYVWVIDPTTKTGRCCTLGRSESSHLLTTSEPRLTLSLRKLFETLGGNYEP